MKIERCKLYIVHLPLRFAFETTYGRQTVRETLIVQLEGDGLTGWGEAGGVEFPDYAYETPAVAALALSEYILPRVMGKSFVNPKALHQAIQDIHGFPFSKTGLECAFLDMYCRAQKVPLYRYLGGRNTNIHSGISLGIEKKLNTLYQRIEYALEHGYKRIKLKIKPGHDIKILESVRKNFGEIPLMVDANSAYTLKNSYKLKRFDEFDLMMIEQPLGQDDLVDHAALQRMLLTPICLDESIRNISDARSAFELGSCRIVNLKFGRVGGLLAAKKIHDFCRKRRIPNWCGGMLETGIGRAHNLALSSLPNMTLPGDISASERYFEEDLIDPPVEVQNGVIKIPETSGIGYQPVLKRIKKHAVKTITFK